MADHILFIDDEPNVLKAIKRMLHGDFEVATAQSGEEAIKMIDQKQPFSVVVCDMRMPGLDGVTTLRRFAIESAESVRIMLSGNADQDTAVRAINEGQIFRYLTKPCDEGELRQTITAAIKQYNLIVAEKTLLEKTLMGSVRMMMDVLSVSQPDAFGRAARARKWVKPLVKCLNDRNVGDAALSKQRSVWEIQLAAMLWPIGLISVPPDLVLRAQHAPDTISAVEEEVLSRAPETAHRLVAHIPRMQNIAEMLLYQDRSFDGKEGWPTGGPKGVAIPEGARILRVLKDLSNAGSSETPDPDMVEVLRNKADCYDPAVLGAALMLWGQRKAESVAVLRKEYSLSVFALMPGDYLLSDISTESGRLLLGKGNQISTAQIERLRNLTKLDKVIEPIVIEREV
jgi:response regulator RpfG family c-di-GMP phosphodiesterase